ncbi:TetR/AcrR family transcriptional regulator [Paenibacillus sp. N4]|uniref:TetR/AcrR family transcriptional regulator n=1 Tax=Paenibacillus vietnamensis TaxID=2590547 RepID=UPI001CD17FE0|nr:TetR/AcrR family transcriptional regulator [Paenibacillus vietnamensis]MCA0754155.1 TetR/AcrR family transcriptional regulator [Paenibacillus vietnamensis]
MTEEPMKRKPGRPKGTGSIQTMQQILRTAAYLFMEQGFEKVSLEGVAQACGVTKASVYYYFNNKGVLFTECLLFVLKIACDQTAEIMNGEGGLRERLLQVAVRHMKNAHLEFETMMREASSGLSEEQITKIRLSEQAIHQLLAEAFSKAMDEGEIVRCDSLLLAHAFTAVLAVKNRKEIINVHKSVEQAAEEIVKLLWTGLQPRQH